MKKVEEEIDIKILVIGAILLTVFGYIYNVKARETRDGVFYGGR